jgi:hypothetical protein
MIDSDDTIKVIFFLCRIYLKIVEEKYVLNIYKVLNILNNLHR